MSLSGLCAFQGSPSSSKIDEGQFLRQFFGILFNTSPGFGKTFPPLIHLHPNLRRSLIAQQHHHLTLALLPKLFIISDSESGKLLLAGGEEEERQGVKLYL